MPRPDKKKVANSDKYKKTLEDLYVKQRKTRTTEGNMKAQQIDAALKSMENADKAPLKSEEIEKWAKKSSYKPKPKPKGRAK